jgi:hypothetical protein
MRDWIADTSQFAEERSDRPLRENTYNVSSCFGLEPTRDSMNHSLRLAPITSG